jgi:hypothetical protein
MEWVGIEATAMPPCRQDGRGGGTGSDDDEITG